MWPCAISLFSVSQRLNAVIIGGVGIFHIDREKIPPTQPGLRHSIACFLSVMAREQSGISWMKVSDCALLHRSRDSVTAKPVFLDPPSSSQSLKSIGKLCLILTTRVIDLNARLVATNDSGGCNTCKCLCKSENDVAIRCDAHRIKWLVPASGLTHQGAAANGGLSPQINHNRFSLRRTPPAR